jgi:hypothetical protein
VLGGRRGCLNTVLWFLVYQCNGCTGTDVFLSSIRAILAFPSYAIFRAEFLLVAVIMALLTCNRLCV